VSLEDDLMKLFAGETTMRILARLGMKEGDAIEHPMLTKSVEKAQRKVEERNFQIRKQVLEYDEIMEHQRQAFYGLRQRVLEGRDVKGLIFDFIRDTVDVAVTTYLDPEYPAQCAAEYAKAKLDCSIPPERLRGKEVNEMERAILEEAAHEARQSIELTIGEYMPMEGSEVSVDFDSAGLIQWAKTRFGVELSAADLRHGGDDERKRVKNMLSQAAERAVHDADLSGLVNFVVPNYGAAELANWVRDKLAFEISVDEVVTAQRAAPDTGVSVTDVLMSKVEGLYKLREIEYPVDFWMEFTRRMAVQSPQEAAANLVSWANTRYKMGWGIDVFKKTPIQVRDELIRESEKFVSEGRLEKEIAAALECKTDAALEAHLKERFSSPMPETMRYLEGRERTDAIKARIENILRAELLHFERTLCLDTLDSAWKDHLYAMDQLRDSINFRAFSQQDPRIEYKKEGSQMFLGMMETVKARITDYIFKARIAPPMNPSAPQGGPGLRPVARPSAPRPAQPTMSSGIMGPGLDGSSMA
jgi:preprotein translocase subunit SecA